MALLNCISWFNFPAFLRCFFVIVFGNFLGESGIWYHVKLSDNAFSILVLLTNRPIDFSISLKATPGCYFIIE